MANRKGPNFKDVEITFYSEGMDAVRTLATENDLSRGVLEKASDSLAARGQDVAGLNAMITELHGEKGTGKGRTPPVTGDTRNYKAQQVKDGGVFGRIPLETLGVEKGGLCNTAFCQDDEGPYLIIRPGAAQGNNEVDDDSTGEGDAVDLSEGF